MAQTDTGLGWSAKSDWLVSLGDVAIAEYSEAGGPSYPNQPMPCVPELVDNDIVLAGFKIFSGSYSVGYLTAYIASEYENTFIAQIPGATYGEIHIISPTTPIHVKIVYVRPNGRIESSPSWSGSGTYDTATGLYWYQFGPRGAQTSYMPQFSSIRDALDAFVLVNYTFKKVNAGYAVACIAKWKTSAGVIIRSPVLISSDTSITDMSTTGTYQFAKYNTRRDGMKFYMSFYQDIPSDLTSSLPVYDISGNEEPYANLDELFNLLCASDQANVKVTETVDPYEDFPYTEEDGGEVDPDPEDDEIEEADLPTMSFATAGFCRIYRPSFSQVSALASYMWTDQNFLQTVINHLKQILENPIDAIISLSIVPCVPAVLTDEEVKVMYVPTGVYMPPVQRQFVEVDCGSYTLKEMYGSALDYNPYTSVQLYLPYVGIVQLDTDEVMGKTLTIGYRIDVVTGVCCAYVKAAGDVLYQFSGHCSIQQPITSADFSGYINAALAAGKLVASIAAAGAGAPAVAATLAGAPTPSISGSESKTVETERNPNTGRQITVGTRKRESQTYNPGASFGEVATRGVSNTVGAVMNSKTIVQHSGGFSGNSGFMAAVRRPYLIVTRPRIANPENYGKYNGRPSMIYLNLGDCTGFTQVQSIQLTGIDATNPELSEIATLLNSGVIL